jgi:hypothetical protein
MIGAAKVLNEITGEIVDAAYKLHTRLGSGLLESSCERVPGPVPAVASGNHRDTEATERARRVRDK